MAARTPFFARITTPSAGGLTYTVPAGKFAIANCFDAASDSGRPTANESMLRLNGVDMFEMQYNSHGRFGPLVFTAGDVIALGLAAGESGSERCALNGFLYDLSTTKVPLRQKLTMSSSYTVPAGKHIVANFFVPWNSLFKIDGVVAAYISGLNKAMDRDWGPFVMNAGQVASISAGDSSIHGFLNGFLYNNTA